MQSSPNYSEELTPLSATLLSAEQSLTNGESMNVAPEKKHRKPRQHSQEKQIPPQVPPTGISEKSANESTRRKDKYDKLEEQLTQISLELLGLPALLTQLYKQEKLNVDVQIVGNQVPAIAHNLVTIARQDEKVMKWLVLAVQDSGYAGLAGNVLGIIIAIYFNHRGIQPGGVFGAMVANMAAGPALDGNRAD